MFKHVKKVYSSVMFLIIFLVLFSSLSVCRVQATNDLNYPLVVYGGEPEGVMAAVSAAREGLPVLLVMNRKTPGGLMTYGGLNYLDLNYDQKGRVINRGLFYEWYQRMGGSVSFSIPKATREFQKMISQEENITVINNVDLCSVETINQHVNKIYVSRNNKKITISGTYFIDASQDAELSVKAGAPFFVGGADRGLPDQKMAATLIIKINNVKWKQLAIEAQTNRYGPSYINQDHAWGFVKLGSKYQPHDPQIRLRGLNIVRDGKSTVYINGMLIFGVDPSDEDSRLKGYQRGKQEARYVVNFLRNKLKGFSEAELADFPDELYIRENRHILAQYQLNTTDLFSNRIFSDTIAFSSYPLDYQASQPNYNGFVLFNPEKYGISFRSLIPLKICNLLVVGKSSGYSSLAAASSRVLPVGMATGEAAGKAAFIAFQSNINFREMSQKTEKIDELKEILFPNRNIKAYRKYIISDKNLLPHIKELLSWGLIMGGYNNKFGLEETISEKEFAHLIIKGLQRRDSPILYEWVPGGLETYSSQESLTRNKATLLLLVAASQDISKFSGQKLYQKACEMNYIPDSINISNNKRLNRKQAYIIISSFIQQSPLPNYLRKIRGVE